MQTVPSIARPKRKPPTKPITQQPDFSIHSMLRHGVAMRSAEDDPARAAFIDDLTAKRKARQQAEA